MRHRAGGGHAGLAETGTGLRTTMMGEFGRREGKGVVVAVGSWEGSEVVYGGCWVQSAV
jgi:hypothetical protein